MPDGRFPEERKNMRSVEGSTLMKSIRTRMSLEHVVLTDPQHPRRGQIVAQFDNEISDYHWAINVVENAYTLKVISRRDI